MQVTLLSSGPYPLPREDHAVSRLLLERLRENGLRVETGVRVERVRQDGRLKTLEIRDGTTTREVQAAEILLATGHRPVTEALDLEKAGWK